MLNPVKSSVLAVFVYSVCAPVMHATETPSPPGATEQQQVGISPWGGNDEIGRLNLVTEQSVAAAISRIKTGETYDLSVDFTIGMPSYDSGGEPRYLHWMVHTPRGTVIDDGLGAGPAASELVTLTADAVTIFTHSGTHIDALNHFGLHGKIYNGFEADRDLGDAGWNKSGVETIPPVIGRGVLIDVATAKELEVLPPSYRISADDLQEALKKQGTALEKGDIVLIRTGQMKYFSEADRYKSNVPGVSMGAAEFLVTSGAMVVGADNLTFETYPSEVEGNPVPVHTYLLAQHGIPILEMVYLEELARDMVYSFAFIGAPIKFQGASGAPIRPIALPME